MSSVSVTDSTVTKVLSRLRDCKMIWFQNFNTGNGFYVKAWQAFPGRAAPVFTTSEFYIPPAGSATEPGYLALDSPGIVDFDWYAYQNSGGTKNLICGQEVGGVPQPGTFQS